MNSLRQVLLVLFTSGILAACGGGGGGSSTPPPIAHEVTISVNNRDYVNGIFTSVQVCTPGTSTCQTIDNVLVDTGSFGLRLLGSATTVSLPAQTNSSGSAIGECILFGDGYTWGPVATSDVHLAGEVASKVAVQIIGQPGFAPAPTACSSGAGQLEDSAAQLGANGILGIGVFAEDCGSYCVQNSASNIYFACDTTSVCTPTTQSLADQVTNPVALFSSDNNGVQIRLPAIGASGAATVSGSLIFGIATESDNGLGSAQALTTDDFGSISTQYGSTLFTKTVIDTGSNALFFSDASITPCTNPTPFYCPATTLNLSAQMIGNNGTKLTVPFSVANTNTLATSGNVAYNDLAGDTGTTLTGYFDWGLPFFYGRDVYFALENKSTPLGDGPYFAY